jgi:hypothetical protein
MTWAIVHTRESRGKGVVADYSSQKWNFLGHKKDVQGKTDHKILKK